MKRLGVNELKRARKRIRNDKHPDATLRLLDAALDADLNEERRIRRARKRVVEGLKTRFTVQLINEVIEANPRPPRPQKPGPRQAMLLKHDSPNGGYDNASFAILDWSPRRRAKWLRDRAAAGDTHVLFYVRSLAWPGIFGNRQPTLDYYNNPKHVRAVMAEIIAAGLIPVPILMDNMEHRRSTDWVGDHQPRIVRGLEAWGADVPDLVLLGIESAGGDLVRPDRFFDVLSANDHRETPPGVFVDDALMAQPHAGKATGLKVLFPEITFGTHYTPGPCLDKHGDVACYQAPWDSHAMAAAALRADLDRFRASAKGRPVWTFEFAQHNNADTEDALMLREIFTEHYPKGGYGC